MEDLSNQLITWTTFTLLAAAVLYIMHALFKARFLGFIASIAAGISFLGLTASIVLRWLASYELGIGRAPLSNLFESLVFFAWTVALVYLILELKTKWRNLGAFILPLAFFILLYAGKQDPSIKPLLPALQSNWLISHVFTCFLGYASFAVSFGLALMYLVTKQGPSPLTDRARTLDALIHQTAVFGFIMLTAGIVTGSIWANSAWGSYWSWDPKETWSLITWIVYAAMLHSRFMRGWHGRRLAYFSILGFACVLFTYLGVNLLLSGLHSYASA